MTRIDHFSRSSTRATTRVNARLTTRVLLVDEHQMMAEMLGEALSVDTGADTDIDIEIVGRSATVEDAYRKARGLCPDVVVLDYLLPDGLGTEAAARISSELPGTAIVMLTSRDDALTRRRAYASGVWMFVSKRAQLTEIRDAVRTVARQREGLEPRPPMRVGIRGDEVLTPRELEVLGLLGAGCTTEEIIGALSLSVHTVRNHIRNALAKLGCSSRLEAVGAAARLGLITVGTDDARTTHERKSGARCHE
jgi:two-component system, NarL family, response regulator DesR